MPSPPVAAVRTERNSQAHRRDIGSEIAETCPSSRPPAGTCRDADAATHRVDVDTFVGAPTPERSSPVPAEVTNSASVPTSCVVDLPKKPKPKLRDEPVRLISIFAGIEASPTRVDDGPHRRLYAAERRRFHVAS